MSIRRTEPQTDRKKTIDEIRAELLLQRDKLQLALTHLDTSLAALDEAVGVVSISRKSPAIDHIVSYLQEVGHAVERKALVQVMFDRGVAPGREDRRLQIDKSIGTNATHPKVRPKPIEIRKREGLEFVGLPEWGEKAWKE